MHPTFGFRSSGPFVPPVISRVLAAAATAVVFVAAWRLPGGSTTAQAGQPSSDQKVVFGYLPCAKGRFAREGGVRQLVWELVKRTSVEAEAFGRDVDPASDRLFLTPLLLWSCDGEAATLTPAQVAGLRRFILGGGFVWVDDPSGGESPAFRHSAQRQLGRVLAGASWRKIPPEHVLFKTFFLVKRPVGRIGGLDYMGIVQQGRLAVLFTGQDLLGALSRGPGGDWEYLCRPGGEVQREESFRFAINVVMYALCLDYKNDRVHLPFILRRRRL